MKLMCEVNTDLLYSKTDGLRSPPSSAIKKPSVSFPIPKVMHVLDQLDQMYYFDFSRCCDEKQR